MFNSQATFMMTAKICHDLSAPLGAMGMGLESLKDGESDTVDFIYDSYSTLEFKLNFYRTLMMTGSQGPVLADFVHLLNKYGKSKNITLHWKNLNDYEFKKNEARLLMGLVYIMMEPLIRGGDCYIEGVDNTGFTIMSTGPCCPMRAEYKEILNAKNIDEMDVTTRNILPAFLMSLVDQLKCTARFEEKDAQIQISIVENPIEN